MDIAEMRTRLRRDLKDVVATTQTPTTVDGCDALWTAVAPNSVTLDTTNKQQGTASMKADINQGHETGLVCYHDIAALDLTGYHWVRFWVRCTSDLAAGDLQLALDDTVGCVSPVKSLDIPALVADVWHEHQVVLGDTSGLGAVVAVGLSVAVDQGPMSVWLDNIRALKDTYKWDDTDLDRHIAHALKDLSYHAPYEMSADLATTPGSRDVDIATLTERVRVLAIEYPVGQYPPRYQRFSLWQDTVTLLGEVVPDGSDCRVHYGKLHTLDSEGSTVPPHLEDLLLVGAQGYALRAYASYAVDRGQPDFRAGHESALETSRELLADFRGGLRRVGRHGRVRRSSLYLPAGEAVDQSGAAGP